MNADNADVSGGQPTPNSSPEVIEHKIGESVYKVPKDFPVHETISKAIVEKDSHIKRLEQENREFRQSLSNIPQQLEQTLSKFGQTQKPEELPDPIEDPKGYHAALRQSVTQEAIKTVEQRIRQDSLAQTEIQSLHTLTGGDREKMIKVGQYATQRGWITADGDVIVPKFAGAIEAAYNAVFLDEIKAAERAVGVEQVKKELAKATENGGSVNTDGLPMSSGNVDLVKLKKTNPARYQQYLREITERDLGGSKRR